MNTLNDILNLIDDEDVEFIRLQFADVFGNLKNVAVTPGQIERVASGRYSFEGKEVFGEEVSEILYLKPDLDSFVILPWRPKQGKVGKLICSVVTADGKVSCHEEHTVAVFEDHTEVLTDLNYKETL